MIFSLLFKNTFNFRSEKMLFIGILPNTHITVCFHKDSPPEHHGPPASGSTWMKKVMIIGGLHLYIFVARILVSGFTPY